MKQHRTTLTGHGHLPGACLALGLKGPGKWRSPFRGRCTALVEGRDGVSAVEFAFVLPVILVLITGMIDIGVLMLTQTDMVRVAQDAARVLSLAQMTEVQTEAYVQGKLDNLGKTLNVDATLPDAAAGETDVTVTISIPMADVIPIDIVGIKNLNVFKKGSLQTRITMRQEVPQ